MTRFEQQLIDKGYLKFILNCKTMKFEIAKGHTISSMVNLDHRYFLKSDFVIVDYKFYLIQAFLYPILLMGSPKVKDRMK